MLPDFVDGADVRVIQRGSSLSFSLETSQRLGVFGYFFGQELQRDKSVEGYVLGLVDDAHPAAAELLDDAIVRDGLVDHWRESYVCETGKSMKAMELAGPHKNT